MLQKGFCLMLFTVTALTPAWSNDPVRKQQPIKQRVSPKVLQEAIALSEYQAEATGASAKLIVETQKLSDRLRATGDSVGADLLQRLITEHEKMIVQVAHYSAPSEQILDLNCSVFRVNVQELPRESVLRRQISNEKVAEIRQELDRLVALKKATLDHFSISTRANQSVRSFDGGEVPVPVPTSDGRMAIEFREHGKKIECLPTMISADQVRVRVAYELSDKDTTESTEVQGNKIPGRTVISFQRTMDVTIGEEGVCSLPMPNSGPRLFLITTVTRQNHSSR